MMKLLAVSFMVVFLSGCTNFTINGTVCDNIMSDPNMQSIPQECRDYDEKEAEKAFFKNEKRDRPDLDDNIEFQNKKEKEE